MSTDCLRRVDAWGVAWEAVEAISCRPCIWLEKGYLFREQADVAPTGGGASERTGHPPPEMVLHVLGGAGPPPRMVQHVLGGGLTPPPGGAWCYSLKSPSLFF